MNNEINLELATKALNDEVGMKLKPKAEDWMGTQMLERKTAASGK